jgi:hypothetical protein
MSTKPFIRLVANVTVELIANRQTVTSYSKKIILVAPERKLSDDLVQDSVVEKLVERIIDRICEINDEHYAAAPKDD